MMGMKPARVSAGTGAADRGCTDSRRYMRISSMMICRSSVSAISWPPGCGLRHSSSRRSSSGQTRPPSSPIQKWVWAKRSKGSDRPARSDSQFRYRQYSVMGSPGSDRWACSMAGPVTYSVSGITLRVMPSMVTLPRPRRV